MNNNLELYNEVRKVPNEAKKTIGAGNLKGYTDINPMWRIKILTEKFGICGFGWYTEIEKSWTEQGANGEVLFFVKLKLYIKKDNEWSKGIEGVGGNTLINKFSKGFKSNDEALKMAETDAISVACKKIGIGADVYWDKDKTKYDNVDTSKPEPNKPKPELKITSKQLNQLNKKYSENDILVALDQLNKSNNKNYKDVSDILQKELVTLGAYIKNITKDGFIK